MSLLADFRFLEPHWLLLLPPLWLLVAVHARRTRRQSMWARVCDASLLGELTRGQGHPGRSLVTGSLLGFVVSVGVVAAAAPSWSRVAQPLMESASARVILLDLSRAMLVQDVPPSRFLHARAAAGEIVADDFAGETGLVVFSGAAFVLAPLSRDSESLRAFIDAVDPSTMPFDGGNLSDALLAGLDLLAASLGERGQILLITAGDSSDGEAVNVARKAASEGQRVSVLAVGSAAGGPLLDDQGRLLRDANGLILLSRSNFPLLRRIADAGNGRLAIATGEDYHGDLLSSRVNAGELVESATREERRDREAANDGAWLVWLMLPAALLLFRRNQLWMLLLVVLAPLPRDAYSADAEVFWSHRERVAFDAYRRQDYDRVRQLSRQPLVLGASYYRSGQFEQALEQFSRADSAAALYNQANAMVQLQRYPEALAGYQRALALDPRLGKARYNKRLLEHFLEQQAGSADQPGQPTGEDPGEENDSDEGRASRLGESTELQANPAEDPEIGTGAGAALQNGQVDPTDRFSGDEEALERFVLRAQEAGQGPAMDTIERWISELPDTSNELWRRKFLRDYRRQRQQDR